MTSINTIMKELKTRRDWGGPAEVEKFFERSLNKIFKQALQEAQEIMTKKQVIAAKSKCTKRYLYVINGRTVFECGVCGEVWSVWGDTPECKGVNKELLSKK